MRTVGPAITAVLVLFASTCLSAQAGSGPNTTKPRPVASVYLSGATSPRPLATLPTRQRSPVRIPSNPAPCDGKFDAVSSPNGAGNNTLFGVSAIDANDVWAVGVFVNSAGTDRTLAEHWNGTSWLIVPTPNPSSLSSDLYSVSALASNDVWAVGAYLFNSRTVFVFSEHWNGTSWAIFQPSGNPSTFTILNAVTAVSTNDVWAVGYYSYGGVDNTLALHWDGHTWGRVPTFNPSTAGQLLAISAYSSTDIWAVGMMDESTTAPPHPTAIHWNGSVWSYVTAPWIGASNPASLINGVVALEPNHAVGVGFGNFVSGSTPRESEVWDLLPGSATTTQLEPGPGTGDNVMLAVAGSGSSVWAVGYYRGAAGSTRQTLVTRATWDSGTHTLTWGPPKASDSPSLISNALYSVAAVTPSVFWATGYQSAPATDQTLTERFCGVHFSVVAPGTAAIGVPFSVDVTAENADASPATRYLGTVHFSSTDPRAVLPSDYTFTPGDNGSHSFSGVVLNSPYSETITVSDTATPIVSGSVVVRAYCAGACQSASGVPGSRGVEPGPTPAPSGGGAVLPGPSPGTGTRVPLRF
jgi:hypothetical protein